MALWLVPSSAASWPWVQPFSRAGVPEQEADVFSSLLSHTKKISRMIYRARAIPAGMASMSHQNTRTMR